MKNTTEKTTLAISERAIKALRSLIVINNDRYEGYKKAISDTKDEELKSLFNQYSAQSKDFKIELENLLGNENLPKEHETKLSGKMINAWMDVKVGLAGNERKALLAACESGEDEIKKIYDVIIANPKEIPLTVMTKINQQRAELQISHDIIKRMRDSA